MHTDEPRELQGVELGYDPRDIDSKRITKAAIGFFVFTVFFFGTGAIIWVRSGYWHTSEINKRRPAIEGPLVQSNTTSKIEIMDLRQQEHKRMTTYGIDDKTGKQWIPIDHAMDLISERGLPSVSSDEPAKSPGNTIKQNAVEPGTTPATTQP